MKTKSEMLFEDFCASNGLTCERIPVSAAKGVQRPDYKVCGPAGVPIVVEVKQFNPNREEASIIERRARGEVVVSGGTPGKRLREAIHKADPQLRALTGGRLPGVLLVYNNVPEHTYHTKPYAVLTAMRGLDVVPVVNFPDPARRPVFLETRPGPGKKLTASDNTHVSAIAILKPASEEGMLLDVFHNRHARMQLPVEGLSGPLVRHFVMQDDELGWEHLDSAV